MKKKKITIPPIGLRIIKSSIAVLLCYIVSILRGDSGIVFYSQIAALWCIHHYIKNSKKLAIQRFIGTIIGAVFGLFVIILEKRINFNATMVNDLLFAFFISVMIILVIYTTVILKRKDATYFSCVVFLSIVVIHIGDQNPYFFVWNRFLDTVIGLIIGISINYFHFPRVKKKNLLLIADLDEQYEYTNINFSPYECVELNRMIEEGMNFTIFTKATPASTIDALRNISINIPIIAMDGAVLYNLKENKYIRSYVISREKARKLNELMKEHDLKSFCNVIIEDMVIIYYEDSIDEEYNGLIEKMRCSPYRNYVRRNLPKDEEVVYFMLLDKTNKINDFKHTLLQLEYQKELKIVNYVYENNPEYSILRIYNKNATKKNMIDYLTCDLTVEKIVLLGRGKENCDIKIDNTKNNQVIKVIKNVFEPIRSIKKKRKEQ